MNILYHLLRPSTPSCSHVERAARKRPCMAFGLVQCWPDKSLCFLSLLFVCVTLRPAAVGISGCWTAAAVMAATTTSNSFRTASWSCNCIAGMWHIITGPLAIQISRMGTAFFCGSRWMISTRQQPAPLNSRPRSSCRVIGIRRTIPAVAQTIGKSGCVIPMVTQSSWRAHMARRMGLGNQRHEAIRRVSE